MPVTKQVDDLVYAGTINNDGFLEVRVTKRSDETLLSKIVKLVEEAQRMKSPPRIFEVYILCGLTFMLACAYKPKT